MTTGAQDDLDLQGVLKEVLETRLFSLRCTGYFTSTLEFSDVVLPLTKLFNKSEIYIKLSTLINSEMARRELEKSKAAIKKICQQDSWSRVANTEEEAVMNIARLLEPLCSKIVLEHRDDFVGKGFKTGNIGIGTVDTWHGNPDMRLTHGTSDCDVNVIFNEAEEKRGTNVYKVQSRVVAMTVTNLFMNRRLYNQPITPVLLMSKRRVCVCMFDCRLDILLYSEKINIVSSHDHVDPRGIVLVWIILHYRCVPMHVCISTIKLYYAVLLL